MKNIKCVYSWVCLLETSAEQVWMRTHPAGQKTARSPSRSILHVSTDTNVRVWCGTAVKMQKTRVSATPSP